MTFQNIQLKVTRLHSNDKATMKKAIEEYAAAVEANIEASQNEAAAKDIKRKAYYRLMRAKDALRAEERELLEMQFNKTRSLW